MSGKKIVNGARNTSAWAFDRFRADALPRMLDDLARFDDEGISEIHCAQVKRALKEITDLAATIPDGGIFRRSIYQHFEEFTRLYTSWNDIDGSDAAASHRRDAVRKNLREVRNRIAIAHRKHFHILDEKLDLKVIDSWYATLNKLVRSVPSFAKLGQAVARYLGRRGLTS